jgi:transcriptional regulator with XRE-family HTH domain
MEAHQLRAARALLAMRIRELAELSGVSKTTIVNLEAGGRSHTATIEKLREVLIAQGIVFIGETAPFYKSTVALRYDMDLPSVKTEEDQQELNEDGIVPKAQAWDDVEIAESAERIEAMRDYLLSHPEEWQQLTTSSKRTLRKVLSGSPSSGSLNS